MAQGEYLLALLAIITGLAITEMVVSVHGLLLNRRSVKWDWLAPLAAALVFILIVYSWGISFRAFSQEPGGLPTWYFIVTLCSVIPFYLAGRAALPDHVNVGDEVDLAGHYQFTSRYLWSAIFVSSFIYFAVVLHDAGFERLPIVLPRMWPIFVNFLLMVPLIIWSNRRLHSILVPIFFIFMCVRALPAPMLG